MRKIWGFILLLVILSFSVDAITFDDIERVQEDMNTYSGLKLNDENIDNIILIEGSNLNLLERAAINLVYAEYPVLKNAKKTTDDEVGLKELKGNDKIMVFIGGPSQNNLAKYYLDMTNDSVRMDYEFISASYGEKVIVISDKRGFLNLDREAVRNSPLAKIMDVKYVPLVASGISIFLLLLFEFVTSYFEGIVEDYKKRKKMIKDKFIGFHMFRIPIRFREILAVLIGALIFALGVTWMFVGKISGFFNIFKIAAIICIGIFVLQEIPRMIISKKKKTLTEFMLYPLGIIVTLVSAFFGSIFGHPGRWLIRNKEYSGKIYYNMMVFMFLLSIGFFITNLIRPSIAMQLAFSVTSTVSLFEMLPFKPLSGREIFNWRPVRWMITFMLFLPSYIAMNFFL